MAAALTVAALPWGMAKPNPRSVAYVSSRCQTACFQGRGVPHPAGQFKQVAEFLDGLGGGAAVGVQADQFRGDHPGVQGAAVEVAQQFAHVGGGGAVHGCLQQFAAFSALQLPQPGLDRRDAAGGHAELVEPQPQQQGQKSRVPGHFAAQAQPAPGLAGLAGDLEQQAQEGRVQRVIKVRQPGVAAVGGQEVLQQVVAADAEEIGFPGQPVEKQGGRRRLDHDPDFHAPGVGNILALAVRLAAAASRRRTRRTSSTAVTMGTMIFRLP